MEMMESRFYETLETVSQKPALWGIKCVEDLSTFILGLDTGKRIYLVRSEDEGFKDFRLNFCEWVSRKYEITSTQGWCQVIRFFSFTDDDTLKLFFKLLQEFKNRHLQTD